MVSTAAEIMREAAAAQCRIILPTDGLAATEFKAGAANRVVENGKLDAGEMVLDIGPASVDAAMAALRECQTVVWNGPMGAFEVPPFDQATNKLAQEAARLTTSGQLVSVAGGGDTLAALHAAGVNADFSYLSLAGGAFLEWLEGKSLPGIAALSQSR